jgi:hypothetical protein
VRPAGEEQVREPVGHGAEVGQRTVRPVVGQGQSARAGDAHPPHRPGTEVEARGPDDHVEFAQPVRRLDAGLGDLDQGCVAQRDQRDVRGVEHLVVAGHVRRAKAAVEVVLGDELVRGGLVLDDAADLLRQERAPLRVRLPAEQQVLVVRGQLRETGAVPDRLVEGPPFFRRVLEGLLAGRLVQEPGDRGGQLRLDLLEVRLQVCLLLGGDRVVVQRRGPRRRPLVERQGLHLAGDLRRDLDAARAGADDGDPLAREIHRTLGPAARVVRLPREVLAARHVGELRHRQHAGGGDQVPRPDLEPVRRTDRPGRRALVPDRGGDPAVQPDVPPQPELVGHVVEVPFGLRLPGELFRPVPLLPQFRREQVTVGVALRVEPAAGVAVPVPGAADPAALLQQQHRVPRLGGDAELVEAEYPGPHHHDVDVLFSGHRLP